MSNTSTPQKGGLKRLFIAVAIPKDISRQLHRIQEAVEKKPEAAHWRWQHQDDYHISIAFPGHQGPDGLKKVKKALSRVNFPSFEMYVQGMRCFNRSGHPHKVPHVLWAGLNPAADAYLKELASVIHTELRKEGIPYGRDGLEPHITLAKVHNEDMPLLLDVIHRHDKFQSTSWNCDEITLYESFNKSRMGNKNQPHPYKIIKTYKLNGPRP
jgi:2'-5' RNA ligase